MAGVEARSLSEPERTLALAEAVAVLAREAAALAHELQRDHPHPNSAADRAAALAREAVGRLETFAHGPALPSEAYRDALAAVSAASVALAVAKQALVDQRPLPPGTRRLPVD